MNLTAILLLKEIQKKS